MAELCDASEAAFNSLTDHMQREELKVMAPAFPLALQVWRLICAHESVTGLRLLERASAEVEASASRLWAPERIVGDA